MYVPAAFAETDPARLFDLIEAYSFGLLISSGDGEPLATHLPLLVEREVAPRGRLIGHMARANPHWQSLDGRRVLCVFAGPHAYVSPTWYEAQNVVPTWNYVAVHVYGTCRLVDEAKAADVVARYVATYERSQAEAWQLDTGTRYFERLVKLIVGFYVEIERTEGKWKLGQNHPPEWRARAARRLAASDDASAREIARLMQASLPAP
jgi:transcriptional regulator